MKNISLLLLLLSVSFSSFAYTSSKNVNNILDYHKRNPNSAMNTKLNGMLNSFALSLDISCREVAYKVVRDTFLINQTNEYKVCMKKAYIFVLNELNVDSNSLETLYEFSKKIRIEVKDNLVDLSNVLGAHCPKNKAIRFGSYVGSGAEVESKFCQINTLGILVDKYFNSTRLEDLSCGAFFSSCDGIEYTREELLELVTE